MVHPQVYMAVEKYDQSPHSFTIPNLSSSPSPSSSRQHLNHSFLPLPPAEKRRISGLRSALDVVKALVLPVVAIGYLAFCYSVHNHIVPVTGEGLVDLSSYSLATVKSGITAISILVISIGLWPMKSLVQDLHSEEFFRVLTAHQAGVPLSTINTISSPSFGTLDSFMAIARRHCSSYFTLSFISSFIVLSASSLAPSALSVDSMLVDGQVLAFSVGAVPANSALNVSDIDAFTFQMPAENVRGNTQEAVAIAWAESSLGSQYMFRLPSNGTSYIIPIPENLPTTTNARWLTDVVALNPSCAWQQTNVSSTLQISSNTTSNNTSFLSDDVYVNMPAVSTDIKLPWNTISIYEIGIIPIDPFDVLNSTSHDPASNGASVWIIAYPTNTSLQSTPVVEFAFTDKPTFTLAIDSDVYQVGIMACSPNPTIETREVVNDGSGNLSIEPRIPRYNQGNLHPSQTAFLLSFALSDLHDSAGPKITFDGFGTELEAQLFFGLDQVKAFNTSLDSFTFTPVSDQEITDMYTCLLQSASKVFVSGNLGSAYVPGRTAAETAVFTSSLPVIVASTVLFAVLSVFIITAHFREGKEAYFTLYSVAAALDGSHLPSQFAQLKNDGVGEIRAGAMRGSSVEDQMAAAWGVRKVMLTRKQDGHDILHLD